MRSNGWVYASVGAALIALLAVPFWLKHRSRPQARITDPSCLSAYQDLYHGNQLNVLVAFGYKDSRPARFVGDRYEKAVFIQRLLTSCRDQETACEFRRDEADSELLHRSVLGPDGRPVEIRLRVLQSSAGPDDDENRRDPFQRWKTAHVKEAFEQALTSADIVFYNGHSRDGGGPDFGPPKITGGKHAAYAWYREHRPGLWLMVHALRKAKTAGPRVVGLFSCISDRWFIDPLSGAKEDLAMITSGKLLYFAEALESSWQALDALLGMKCQPEFERALGTRPDQAGTTRISGFF